MSPASHCFWVACGSLRSILCSPSDESGSTRHELLLTGGADTIDLRIRRESRGAIDLAPSPRAERRDDLVQTELGVRSQRHRRLLWIGCIPFLHFVRGQVCVAKYAHVCHSEHGCHSERSEESSGGLGCFASRFFAALRMTWKPSRRHLIWDAPLWIVDCRKNPLAMSWCRTGAR